MKSSTTYASDLTTIGDGSKHMIGYAQNAQSGYIEAPTSSQQQDGVVPLDRLPAQWWNWFLNKATTRFTESEDFLENALAELDGILDVMGVAPDATSTIQLKTMFSSTYLQNYLPKIAEAASAFSPDGAHSNSLIVTDDDGNSGYSIKKIPYAPGLVVTTQITTAAKTITLPYNCPFDGQTIKVVFANGHEAANATDYMTLNSIPIVSNQNGTLANLPIHQLTAGTYSVLQNNTVLEMYYTATGFNGNPAWVVVGNPVVLSSSDYTIYADGFNLQAYSSDQNVLAEMEVFSGYGSPMPYDGVFYCGASNNASKPTSRVFLNGTTAAYFGFNGSAGTVDGTSSVPFIKGDVITVEGEALFLSYVRYYKLRDYTGR